MCCGETIQLCTWELQKLPLQKFCLPKKMLQNRGANPPSLRKNSATQYLTCSLANLRKILTQGKSALDVRCSQRRAGQVEELGGRNACGKRQPLRSNYKHSDLSSLTAEGIKCFLLSLNGFMQQQIDVEVGLKCNLCAGTQVRVLYVNQLHFHPIVFTSGRNMD